ncbi:hypothetical protein E2C01_008057 [Portunus trituberculatus]|uniref:Uncharacterized protein n=1 Tax=Portunus trituberculatus TaxID=210409 RepID=A0A5B7D234_PORTR|nr:hypothetical protein [Portunus trituberculatus]
MNEQDRLKNTYARVALLFSRIENFLRVFGRPLESTRNVVKEELKVAHHNKLPGPPFFDSARLGHLNVALISCANASSWVNTKRSFGWRETKRKKSGQNT